MRASLAQRRVSANIHSMRNVEIKARVADMDAFCLRAAEAAGLPLDSATLLIQSDTFFVTPRGRCGPRNAGRPATRARSRRRRLKLRCVNERAELIFYERADTEGPKTSDYEIARLRGDEADALRSTLSRAYGVVGQVDKRRRLFMVGQTRVHCDVVEGLGAFMVRAQRGWAAAGRVCDAAGGGGRSWRWCWRSSSRPRRARRSRMR